MKSYDLQSGLIKRETITRTHTKLKSWHQSYICAFRGPLHCMNYIGFLPGSKKNGIYVFTDLHMADYFVEMIDGMFSQIKAATGQ